MMDDNSYTLKEKRFGPTDFVLVSTSRDGLHWLVTAYIHHNDPVRLPQVRHVRARAVCDQHWTEAHAPPGKVFQDVAVTLTEQNIWLVLNFVKDTRPFAALRELADRIEIAQGLAPPPPPPPPPPGARGMTTWRDKARPIIECVLRDTAGADEKVIRQALFDAYPFGPREHHPYKVWLDEIRRQRGLKPPSAPAPAPAGQWALFSEEE